jgi:DNA-binding CsgD family transcriptional regulator
VSTHLRAIREKLGANSLHDLVNYAHRVGLR